jgi:hypothetical protein
MIDEREAGKTPVVDEGAWIYVMGLGGDRSADDSLRERVVEACEAGGWPTVSQPSAGGACSRDPGHLFEGIRHAVEHADCVVALLGDSAEMVDAELALVYSHRRPIVGMRVCGESYPVSKVEAMLEGYERARVITCDDAAECAAELRTVFDDPEFAATIRKAAGELAAGA